MAFQNAQVYPSARVPSPTDEPPASQKAWENALEAAIQAGQKPLNESKAMERAILLAMPMFDMIQSELREPIVDLAMALGELGKLPREQQAVVLKTMKSFGAYLGTLELRELPRLKWYEPALLWSIGTVQGQQAEFFNYDRKSQRDRYGFLSTNLPIPHQLPKDVRFEAKQFRLYSFDTGDCVPLDQEELLLQAPSIEISELVPQDTRSLRMGEFYRTTRIKSNQVVSGPPQTPAHPINKNDADWMQSVLARATGFQTTVFAPELTNRKISWRMRTVGTNRLDGYAFLAVLVGRVLSDERKENDPR